MTWSGFYLTVLAIGGAVAIVAILVRGARRRRHGLNPIEVDARTTRGKGRTGAAGDRQWGGPPDGGGA